MTQELVAILATLDGSIGKEVVNLWNILDQDFEAREAMVFNKPSITFQGGSIASLEEIRKDFLLLKDEIKKCSIHTTGISHSNREIVYFSIDKNEELTEISKVINAFLLIYCDELMPSYMPKEWKPHIILAMNDLNDSNFDKFFTMYGDESSDFTEEINSLQLVRFMPDGKLETLETITLHG